MKTVLGGMFESAFVRMVDEKRDPQRNKTSHPYYLDLNRNTDKIYRDGAGTFVALSGAVPFPLELDWNGGEIAAQCGIEGATRDADNLEQRERYDAMQAVVDAVPAALSERSKLHTGQLDLKGYSEDIVETYLLKRSNQDLDITRAYVRRLLQQVLAANESDARLLLAEPDIALAAEIAAFIFEGSYDLPFPDLQNKIIDPFSLVEGVLNFSPHDIDSIEAVRNDPEIRRYAEEISAEMAKEETSGVTEAAIKAYLETSAGRKVGDVFEIASWVVKPLHYVPGVDAMLTMAEDAKDAVGAAIKWNRRYKDWHIIGVKMQTVATEDFFKRLSNRYPQVR